MRKIAVLSLLTCLLALAVIDAKKCKKSFENKYQTCLSQGFKGSIEGCVGADIVLQKKKLKDCPKIEKKLKSCGFSCEPEPEPKPSCNLMVAGSASINVHEDSTLTVKWNADIHRPDAKGKIDQGTIPHTGYVNFPDDRTYKFNFYPEEGTIYWDGDRGTTNIIWPDVKCKQELQPEPEPKPSCNLMVAGSASINVHEDSTLTVKWNADIHRPDAKGKIDQGTIPHTGYVNFPDDRTYKFNFYPEEGTIYWDGDRGTTNIIWPDVKCEA